MVIRLIPTSVVRPMGGIAGTDDEDEPTPNAKREAVTLWPKFTAPHVDAAVPVPYATLFREAWDVLSASPRASAALSRRCLQQLLHDHFKIKERDLQTEINKLIGTKALPSHVNDDLHALRSVGNFAAHPQKNLVTGDIVDVDDGEAGWLLALLQALFDAAFVEPARHTQRKQAWNAKAATAGKPPV